MVAMVAKVEKTYFSLEQMKTHLREILLFDISSKEKDGLILELYMCSVMPFYKDQLCDWSTAILDLEEEGFELEDKNNLGKKEEELCDCYDSGDKEALMPTCPNCGQRS
ncbi:MAG: hypothetical protein DRQ88_06090 [Epsilonproteobacteria bacterium]|nr:MAG: hypothetical protein DRQ88_06090 [Campylobacterota bacterium]